MQEIILLTIISIYFLVEETEDTDAKLMKAVLFAHMCIGAVISNL
jgi:hypothetical protein